MGKALLGAGFLGAAGLAFGAVRTATRGGGSMPPSPSAKRAVVLGAGFAGLAAAKELAAGRGGADLDVLLIDRQNYHLFTPILYQVATAGVLPDNVAHPVRYEAGSQGYRFQESTVESIDLEAKRVLTDDGAIPFDYLVVALGSTTNYFGMDAVVEHSLPLKTLGDGVAIRNRIIDALERAEVERDPVDRRALLTFIVVGGGYTGVELVTSLKDLLSKILLKDYPSIDPAEVRVLVVEAIGQVMTGFDRALADRAENVMRDKEIEVLLNTPVNRIEPGGIHTATGELIPSRTVVWAAGVRASALTAELPGTRGRDGRITVNDRMQADGRDDVYITGDCAAYIAPGDERPLPANAPIAIAMGKTAGKNVLHSVRGEPTEPFAYRRQGQLVALGYLDAVAELFGRIRLTGPLGWLAWRTVYMYKLTGMKNRFGVLVDWAFGVALRRDTNRLDVG